MNNTQPYSSIQSEIYDCDTWYANYKYSENAQRIAALIKDVSVTSLLELASGTGTYLSAFSEYYSQVEGLELSTDMIDVSVKKYPEFTVHLGNMIDFHLGKRYDAIALLCGSIATVAQSTEAESILAVQNMIRCCRKHLNDKGIIIIENYGQPQPAKEWVLSSQHTLEDKNVSQHTIKTIESSSFLVLTYHFLITPKNPHLPTIYTTEIHRNYLCAVEKLISLFEQENFCVKLHIPSFAMEGRDLIVFELMES